MENGVKNGENTKFSSENQPSSEAKSRGWTRRKEALSLIGGIQKYLEMPYSRLKKLNEDDLTGREVLHLRFALNVIESPSTRRFWVDKHIPVIRELKEEEPKPKRYTRVSISSVEELERYYKVKKQLAEIENN